MDLAPSDAAPDSIQPSEDKPHDGRPKVDPITRRAQMLRAFKHRNYRLFFVGQFVSLCGTFLSTVAVIWLVYNLTHEPWWLGVVGFCGQIPLFAVSPFAGVLVDRIDRRSLLVLTQVLSMVQSVLLGLLVLTGMVWQPGVGVLAIAGLAMFQGLINSFDLPARQAFLVEMVTDRADLPNAIALNSTMVHLARLAGPALAGFLIDRVGAGWCFMLDGTSYLAVIASLLMMRVVSRPRPTSHPSVLHGLTEGMRYAWGHKPIRALLLLMGLISLAGMPAFSTLVPVFSHHFGGEGSDAKYLGFLMAASGLGALVGALQLAGRSSVKGLGSLIGGASVLFGVALIVFSFSRSMWLAMFVVPVAGWAMLMTFASSNTLLQTLVDEEKRGRVMSLFTVAFIGMTPFGNLMAGALAKWFADLFRAEPQSWAMWDASQAAGNANLFGASMTLRVCGTICLIAAGLFVWKLPGLRRQAREHYAEIDRVKGSIG